MAGRRILVGLAREIVDHHAVTGAAHPQAHRIAPQHVDRLLAHAERARAVRREVAAGIGRIDPLDEQVLAVEVGGGEAPADRAVMAEHDAGRARRGGAADVEARPDQPREIPGAGKAERQMRVVGEQRLARHRMRAGQDPFVRGLALARRQVVGGAIEAVEIEPVQRLVDQRQRGVAAFARRIDQEFRGLVADLLGEPQAQQLAAPVAVEAERHDLRPDHRIGRLPGVRPIASQRQQLDQGELEAELLVVGGEPGVHAGRVGLEHAANGGRERADAVRCGAIEPEPAHRAIGVDDAAADDRRRHDLGEPALAEPAHHLHLPEAVLGMHEAQAEGGILDRARDDVRDRLLVAHDLDRRLQPLGVEAAGIGGQGAAHLEIGAGAEHEHGQHEAGQQLRQPGREADERPHRVSRRYTKGWRRGRRRGRGRRGGSWDRRRPTS